MGVSSLTDERNYNTPALQRLTDYCNCCTHSFIAGAAFFQFHVVKVAVYSNFLSLNVENDDDDNDDLYWHLL